MNKAAIHQLKKLIEISDISASTVDLVVKRTTPYITIFRTYSRTKSARLFGANFDPVKKVFTKQLKL